MNKLEEIKLKLDKLIQSRDPETAHIGADEMLVQVIDELTSIIMEPAIVGIIDEIKTSYRAVPKWYA